MLSLNVKPVLYLPHQVSAQKWTNVRISPPSFFTPLLLFPLPFPLPLPSSPPLPFPSHPSFPSPSSTLSRHAPHSHSPPPTPFSPFPPLPQSSPPPPPPPQIIVNKGAVSTDMYIVQVGEAEVMTERRLPPVAVLKEGDIFGEVSWHIYRRTTMTLSSCAVQSNLQV